MRHLATVQRVIDVQPILGADAIEVASVLGWKVVVKKGDFSVGDLAIYCEIDSVMPDKPEFEFLRNRKFRVRTIKLRGQISQGILFSISSGANYEEGDDVTQDMGVKKYELPEVIRRRKLNLISADYIMKKITTHPLTYIFVPVTIPLVKNFWKKHKSVTFPTHLVPQTDEPRVQSYPKVLEEIRGVSCIGTIKKDGTSATYILYDNEFLVCSRNRVIANAYEDCYYEENYYWKVAISHDIENKMRSSGIKNFAIQGEICGPGIQNNRLNLREHKLFVFNIFDIGSQRYLSDPEMRIIVDKMGLRAVSIVYTVDDFDFTVDQLLEMSDIRYSSGYPAEGVVWRPIEEMYSRVLQDRMSFKVINNKYLLKEND